jgi:subfamily B ATP-binding cassette protein MsbA
MKYIGQKIITDMQVDLYRHLIHADVAYLMNQSSGKLISKFTNDIVTMRAAVSNLLTSLARDALTVVFLVALMLYQSVTLSLIAFTVFPLALVPIIKMGKRMRRVANSIQDELEHYTSQLDNTFHSIRVIKSYAREEFEIQKVGSKIDKIFQLYKKAITTSTVTSPLIEALSGIAVAAVIWYGGTEVLNGHTTPGSFFAFIMAFISAYRPVKSLADLNTNLQEGLASARRFFKILSIKPEIKDQDGALPLKVEGGEVVFKNINFSYPSGKKALNSLSFTIPAGKTVALVGASGGGKSTITNLLLRFFEQQSGSIYIDQQNLDSVTIASLRQAIAIVTQDVMLFEDSVLNNIAYGNLEASEEEIKAAAKLASAHEFIENLPQNYQTQIGPNGIKLSGGQRQRLSIARAILKNSPILILDEATSSLDPVTEQEIHNSFMGLRKNRTTLIIAHRLSTIIDADLICVIKGGEIVESGTHQALLSKGGEYSRLYATGNDE